MGSNHSGFFRLPTATMETTRMGTMSSFSEPSPVVFLRQILKSRVSVNPRYSVRAFARDLKLSHSFVSQVLNERRGISFQTASAIAAHLRLEPKSRLSFLESLARQHMDGVVGAKAERSLKTAASEQVLEADYFHTVSSWYHGAILELMSIEGFKGDIRWIASRLGIKAPEARDGLARLQRLGLAKKEGARWVRSSPHIYFPNARPDIAMQRYHLETAEKARECLSSLRRENYGERDMTALSVAIDPARLPAARKEIAKFRKKMNLFLSKGSVSEVYQLNIQLFPLSRTRKGKRNAP